VLPKKHRLKKKNDFARVTRGGRTAAIQYLVLRFMANQREESRVGFVCGKKVAKRAVARNRIKRRLMEIVRALLPSIRPGFDLIFLTRPGIADLEFEEIKMAVEGLLKRARILTNNK